MNKIIVSYCRVSITEQSTKGSALDNQQHTNNTAVAQLMTNGKSIWLAVSQSRLLGSREQC